MQNDDGLYTNVTNDMSVAKNKYILAHDGNRFRFPFPPYVSMIITFKGIITIFSNCLQLN